MRKALFLALFLAVFVQLSITSIASAKGPYGNIHVGQWKGGAFTDDNTGAFSHCGATVSPRHSWATIIAWFLQYYHAVLPFGLSGNRVINNCRPHKLINLLSSE